MLLHQEAREKMIDLNDFNLFMAYQYFLVCYLICHRNENEPHREKTAKLISAFVFATYIVQYLYFLYTKFQASSHLVWLYSLVCVGPGRKP